MDKNAIKKFAVWARRELIARVSQKAMQYGISEGIELTSDIEIVNGKILSNTEITQRKSLVKRIKDLGKDGYRQTMEEAAYTWFNRFIAIRYMEVNGYLPSHVRVFSDENGAFKPQILTEAMTVELEGLDREKVYSLKNANKNEELYKYLVIKQCDNLISLLPMMFTRIDDYTQLLFPDNILREGSVISEMVSSIPEDDWKDAVQIIGWLYQYYNAEPKDEVFKALKNNVKVSKDNIPAATQIFTPDWIVRYMVENSLGRLWIEGHPNPSMRQTWKYYIDNAEQEPDVEKQLQKIRAEYAAIKPEDLKVIDPCMGSGHILVYMFDVLEQIYQSCGYSSRDAARLILENNLYGLDIDDRCSQLAYFAVMMKARQYDRRILTYGIRPNILAIQESQGLTDSDFDRFGKASFTARRIYETFIDAKIYGSAINVDCTPERIKDLEKALEEMISMSDYGTLFAQSECDRLTNAMRPLMLQAKILMQKYHVVVTNPPYMGAGNMDDKLSKYVKRYYPDSKTDLFSVFIERAQAFSVNIGFTSLITMESWMFLSSFEKLREKILHERTIVNMVHMPYLGKGGTSLGINFGTAAVISMNNRVPRYLAQYEYTVYYECDNDGIPFVFPAINERWKTARHEDFNKIPGSPISYWASENYLHVFELGERIDSFAFPKQGLATGDNNRFTRLWFEIGSTRFAPNCESSADAANRKVKWVPYNKGGDFRKWYGNVTYVVNWENDGQEIRNFYGENGKLASRPQNVEFYFKQCGTWSKVTSASFSMRYIPHGYVFDVAGCSLFCDEKRLKYILAFANTVCNKAILSFISPTLNFEVGHVASLPIIWSDEKKTDVDQLCNENISLSKADWDSVETSWDFKRHPLLPRQGETRIVDCYNLWWQECENRFRTLKTNEEELNRIFINIYGLQRELKSDVKDDDVTVRKADIVRDVKSLISYAVGCMFGRYSLDYEGLAYAGETWDSSKYKTFIPDADNVLPICDDDYFEDDIVSRFVEFIRVVYGADTLEENLQFIAQQLGGSGSARDTIRAYFLNDFFEDHCATYQVTGSGKRPIYWLFSSGKKNGFKALVYMHRYQPDTIARLRTDYVHQLQAKYRTAIEEIESRIDGSRGAEVASLKRRLQKLKDQSEELRLYEEKVHHFADQMIRIDLDDGFKKNYPIFKDIVEKVK